MTSTPSEPRFATVHEQNLAVPMRDGTVLRANVTRPEAAGRYPVLVERTPYNKEAGSENAVGASVLRDGYDTIEWAAAQPWSDGNVGMIGGSYSGAAHPASFVYDPVRPVPTRGGNTLSIANGVYDQREVEEQCLTFTSAPLDQELEATGPVTAVLYGLSSAPDTDWVVRLTDVHPDGYARLLCDGILRARYRDSFRAPVLLERGQVYRFTVDLWATSNVFLPGHRIWVSVTSSCFPRFDRNLNTGGPIHREVAGAVAINTVFFDEARPSHIVLPVIARS